MKYVELNATMNNLSGVLSAQAYLQLLPQLAPSLSAGARAFATDPQHYDFYSRRCVKDLTIDDLFPGRRRPTDHRDRIQTQLLEA